MHACPLQAPTSTSVSSPLVSVPIGGVLPVTVTVLNTDAASVLPLMVSMACHHSLP